MTVKDVLIIGAVLLFALAIISEFTGWRFPWIPAGLMLFAAAFYSKVS